MTGDWEDGEEKRAEERPGYSKRLFWERRMNRDQNQEQGTQVGEVSVRK